MIKFNKNNYNDRNSIFDVVGFLCLLFAGILLLSYFSINKESITLNDNVSQNLLGIFGAYISVYSFLAFGYSSFIFPKIFLREFKESIIETLANIIVKIINPEITITKAPVFPNKEIKLSPITFPIIPPFL